MRANNHREDMIMVALKSTALSAICAAFLVAVTAGAASAASSSIAKAAMSGKKLDPDCIKKCNDIVDPCMGKAGNVANSKWICARSYSNCVGECKF
ncbi:MAG: hypothetical protein ACREDD_05505 [Methylocella sp.]